VNGLRSYIESKYLFEIKVDRDKDRYRDTKGAAGRGIWIKLAMTQLEQLQQRAMKENRAGSPR
jgi:predicted RNA-binding protein YlxR (DUF448 family)